MNLLVDTHAMLWYAGGDDRLSKEARAAIENSANTNYLSIASWWEIAIKCSIQMIYLDIAFDVFMKDRIREVFRILPIDPQHLPMLTTLPFHHRDPFDRLIISQAIMEAMTICTGDDSFSRYDVQVIW